MDSNKLIEKEHKYIDMICDKFNYDSNIRHLLYIIIPAFIIKYGIKRENLIRKTFENISCVCHRNILQYERVKYLLVLTL